MSESALLPLAVTLTVLRVRHGWRQGRLARALRLSGKELSAYETGRKPLSRDRLEELIAPMGLGPEAIDSTLFWLEVRDLEITGPPGSPFEVDEPERRRLMHVATTAGWTALHTTLSVLTRGRWSRQALEARSWVPELWRCLGPHGPEDRRLLVEGGDKFRSWALAEFLAGLSAQAAADAPPKALELAEIALFIAERALGGELWRTRLQGYCYAFIGNARRVGGELRGADRAFAQARLLWEAGAAADPGVLDGSRLLDLEASLRRDQRRFPEAIVLLDQALRASATPARAAHILLAKGFTHEQMGDCEGAIAALQQAAPLIDAEREPRQLFGLRFNLAVNLCHLERYAEAVPLVAEVRELAIALRKDLDLLRVLWLEARVAAGLGRRTEAVAALRQVRADFAARRLAYDAALATLNLAVLLVEDESTAEVRELAAEMVPIFASLDVHRETLAAFQLFWQAAEQEAATADLGRRLLRFLERARYDPGLRFDPDSPDGVGPRGSRGSR